MRSLLSPSEGHCQPHSLHHVTRQWQRGLWVFPDLVSRSLIALSHRRAKTQLGTTTFTSFSRAEWGLSWAVKAGRILEMKRLLFSADCKDNCQSWKAVKPPCLFSPPCPSTPLSSLESLHGAAQNHWPSYRTRPWLNLRRHELRGKRRLPPPCLFKLKQRLWFLSVCKNFTRICMQFSPLLVLPKSSRRFSKEWGAVMAGERGVKVLINGP